MSTTVDSRVLEMRFDNKQFESGVSTTMSTLDKLKQKLNFTGGTKGLEDVGKAAKNVNMSGLGTAVDSVQAKFSAMQVVGVTALANITNSAVNAGKRMIESLTIAPVKDGFNEYEMTLNAIQTTMAGTGKTAKEVETELKKLDEYADKTVYSTADMLNNLPKFTNAGVELEQATKAMIGIANATALAGGDAGKASIAFYNLGQAIGTGYLTRMDYNSINNAAGIATMEWKNQMVEAAIAAGTLKKVGEDSYKAGNKTLTLQQLFIDGLQEQWATTDVMMKVFGDYGDETTEIGKKSYSAAQDIKTFSMMMDSLKATAGTGWKDTWQIIFGDLDEAKKMWTGLTNFISNIITKFADFRNAILESALGQGFGKLSEKIKSIFDGISKVTDPVKDAISSISGITKSLEEHNAVVKSVINGDWGHMQKRWDALTEAGYDWVYVQNKVNETLGNSKRRTSEYTKWLEKQGEAAEETGDKTDELSGKEKFRIKQLLAMSEAELKAAGYTQEQIDSLKELIETADKLGLSVTELLDNIDEIDGRWLLLNSFKNLGNMLTGIGTAAKEAWQYIFPEATIESIANGIFNMIAAFHKFTSGLKLMVDVVDEDGNTFRELNDNGIKLARTFAGIFAALDIVLTVIGGPLKIAFKIISQLLSAFGFNILDVTAWIGDGLVGLRDFMDGILDFSGAFEKIVDPVKNAINTFKEWIAKLKETENLPQEIAKGIANGFGKAFDAVKNFFKKIPEFFTNGFAAFSDSPIAGFVDKLRSGLGVAGDTIVELGKIILNNIAAALGVDSFEDISADSIAGLVQGFKDGASKVWASAVEMVSNLVAKVKEFLGIHSPSTVFAAIGGFIIAGLVAGLQNGIPDSLGAIKDVFQPMLDWIKGIDLGSVMAAAVGIGTAVTGYKAIDALGSFASVFEGIGEVLGSAAYTVKKLAKPIKNVVNGFAKIEKAVAFNIQMEGVKTLATSLLFLVGAVVVLTFFEPAELWNAVGIILALSVILGVLAFAMSKINNSSLDIGKEGLSVKGLTSGLIQIGAAILLIGLTVKAIGTMKPEEAKQGMDRLVQIVGLILATTWLFGKFVDGEAAKNINGFGKMMVKMAIALLLMTAVLKICSKLTFTKDQEYMIIGVLGTFVLMILAMAAISKLAGNSIDKMGKMMVSMSISLLLMVGVMKLAGKLTPDELVAGMNFLKIFGGFVAAMALIGALGGKAIEGVGKMMLSLSVSMLLMVGVMKLVGMLTVGEMIKGALAIVAFGVMITLMVKSIMKNGSEAPKVAATILAFSVAIALLAGVAIVCSLISLPGLMKGVAAVGVLTLMMKGLIKATQGATQVTGTIIAITAAIAVLVAAVALLTLIDPVKLAISTGVMVVLMGMLALVIKASKTATQAWGALAALAGVILILGGVLYTLATLPVESTIGSAIALGGLMLVMTGVLKAMVDIGLMARQAVQGVVALTTLAVPLALVALILAMMTGLGVQDALPNAAALSLLLITMSAACAIMSTIPVMAAVNGALGLAAFIGIMAGVLLILGGLSKIPGFNEVIADGGTTLSLIGKALGAFVGSIVAGFAGAVLTILPALGEALSGFMTGVTPFIAGVKMVDEQVLAGAGILVAALLAFTVAEFLAGIASLSGLGLVALGLELSAFMLAVKPFVDNAKLITPESMAGVKALAETILILTAANVIEGLSSLFGGGNSLEKFASQLPVLGKGLAAFSESLGTFSEDQLATVNCAAQAVKTLASAASEIPNAGGLLASLVGENELGTFASQFPVLGSGLRGFLDNVGTFSEEQVTTVNCAAQAIKSLAEASSQIPNSGGWLGQIVGENDLGPFASQFPVLGTGLRGFLDNVGTFTEDQVATVDCAAQAIKTLAQASSEIPNSGGWIGAIVGDNDLGTFAEQFPSLGTGLAGFLTNVGTFTPEQVSTVDCAAKAVATLASVASTIPNEGGWISKIVGDNGLGTFAANFPKLGEGLAGFVSKLGTFTAEQVATVNSAVRAINALSGLANADLSGAKKNISGFGDKLPDLGEDISSFCSKMPDSASMSTAINNINRILAAVRSIANANSGALATFASNLQKVGKNAVDKFVGAFTSNSAKTDLEDAAKKLGDKVVDGFEAKERAIKTAGEDAAKKAVDGAGTQDDEAETAGKNLGAGYVRGVKAKEQAAYDAGYAVGAAGAQGINDGQQSGSPSKLAAQSGKWLAEGYVIGIAKMGRQVSQAGNSVGETATKSLSTSISRIADLVSTDIDSQPTIRPVLDLSDVRSGAATLGNMLNLDSTIGVSSNVRAISSMMSQRSQNGVNADVVSAIDKLNKKMDNIQNASYTINGITYDDGSNITDAVRTLVRATQIERRV